VLVIPGATITIENFEDTGAAPNAKPRGRGTVGEALGHTTSKCPIMPAA
jgi:hypothetical protein